MPKLCMLNRIVGYQSESDHLRIEESIRWGLEPPKEQIPQRGPNATGQRHKLDSGATSLKQA